MEHLTLFLESKLSNTSDDCTQHSTLGKLITLSYEPSDFLNYGKAGPKFQEKCCIAYPEEVWLIEYKKMTGTNML